MQVFKHFSFKFDEMKPDGELILACKDIQRNKFP